MISYQLKALVALAICFSATPSPASPITLTTIWTDFGTGGQVEVVSTVNGLTYGYQVTNLTYDPFGGEDNYGITIFNPRSLNYNVNPAVLAANAVDGWKTMGPFSFHPYVNWNRETVGFLADPSDPNRPQVGLLPGDSAYFELTVDKGTPQVLQGIVASSYRWGNFTHFGANSLRGDLLYPFISQINSIPEPSTLALLTLGLISAFFSRRREGK